MSIKAIHHDRLQREPLEKIFSEVWQNINQPAPEGNSTLDFILSYEERCDPEPQSFETQKVVATIIQWLGSAIGQDFLAKVIEKAMKENVPLPMMEPASCCFGKSLTHPKWR